MLYLVARVFLVLAYGVSSVSPSIADQTNPAIPLAPGYGKLDYELPAPGSYKLPPMGQAADGEVLDSNGKPVRLHELYENKFTLLSFVYSTCSDVNGCPLTAYVFYKIKAAMKSDPALANSLQLISLSFDPTHDTPEVLQLYADNFRYAGNKGDWRFLTTKSESQLSPILDAYNQDVQRQLNDQGEDSSDFSHILRVFLIDPSKRIRNIYSVAFLHADLLLTDVRSLLLEEEAYPIVKTSDTRNHRVSADTLGHDKSNVSQYEALNRESNTELMELEKNPPLGLPPVPVPIDNPLTPEKVTLGQKLFFDRRLSLNNTMSCAMCHVPGQGFTNNELAMAVGIEGRTVRRNSPTILNTAYLKSLFHDGRETTLEQQIWGPLLAKNEMGNPSVSTVLEKIHNLADYQGRFKAAFDGRKASMETLGMAIASYERSLVSANSNFDRWYFGKQDSALIGGAKRGFKLFTGKAKCASCHTITNEYALFTDSLLHNTGLGYRASMGIANETERVQLAPGVFVDVDPSILDKVGEPPPADLGRYEITQNPQDRWKYNTPSLRNVALTAPFMHNGALSTLKEVVQFYNEGGISNEGLDPLIRPLNLTNDEIDDIVAFLRSLTGDNIETLVTDALATPVGDPDSQPERNNSDRRISIDDDFELTDHNGKVFRLSQLRGKIVLVFFGYTFCPDICPMELTEIASALKSLDADAAKIQALFITVDPQRDTPEVLKNYVQYFHPDLIGLTGSVKQLAQTAEKYHVTIKKEDPKKGSNTVEHNGNLFILGPDGNTATAVPYGFPAEHIVAQVQTMIKKYGL